MALSTKRKTDMVEKCLRFVCSGLLCAPVVGLMVRSAVTDCAAETNEYRLLVPSDENGRIWSVERSLADVPGLMRTTWRCKLKRRSRRPPSVERAP